MNPLNTYPGARKIAYLIQWVVTGVLGILGVIYAAQDTAPRWFVIAGAVASFVWTYLGLTAQSNVTGTDADGYKITTTPPSEPPSSPSSTDTPES